MNEQSMIETIRSVYEAFGSGDLPGILARLDDDVDWASETTSTAAPWYGVRHGKAEVAEFFEQFGSTMAVQEFIPVSLAANDSDVLSVVRMRAEHRASGRVLAMDLHHRFTFRDGKIVYYRGTEDTAQTEAAFRS
ncbi:nuclear transport factor 2 family protein [Kitasatospora sp. NPDC048540]|uniref:nuclear transport factor 2 family protein n=1 Tax=unclassified Kitasatospora TaxID=2633591 RepID=UPI0006901CE0|nr:nuclear transport factor 2 family protein [Kitasatospora sp. MBT63]